MATAIDVTGQNQRFFLTTDEFKSLVSEALTKALKVPFPYPKPEGEFGSAALAPRLVLTEKRLTILSNNGYTVVHEIGRRRKDNKLRIDKGSSRWWIPSDMRISFHAGWHRTDEGIDVYLETEPHAGSGNHKDAVELAVIMRDNKINLHPFVLDLVSKDGRMTLSWDSLGIEPHTKLADAFREFLRSISQKNPWARAFINNRIALDKVYSPFGPTPYQWSQHDGGSYESPGFVPASLKEVLFNRWLDQYKEFLRIISPQ